MVALVFLIACGKSGDGKTDQSDPRCPAGTKFVSKTVPVGGLGTRKTWWRCETADGVKEGPAVELAADDIYGDWVGVNPGGGESKSIERWLEWSGSYKHGKREGKWTAIDV